MKILIDMRVLWMIIVVLVVLTGCDKNSHPPINYSYDVINVWPHDTNAFTEGLVFHDGVLLESTGLNGQSTLRKVDLKTGGVIKRVNVPATFFAEGLTVLGDRVFQLTYTSHKGFVYDLESFQFKYEFPFKGEGWGLATDGQWLIASDGTDRIRFLDPITFKEHRAIRVRLQGKRVIFINELEYIKGEIWANVWGVDYVLRIDPATGIVLGKIDFSGLREKDDRDVKKRVLNGIAFDKVGDRVFVTGKRWPKLFEVRLKLK